MKEEYRQPPPFYNPPPTYEQQPPTNPHFAKCTNYKPAKPSFIPKYVRTETEKIVYTNFEKTLKEARDRAAPTAPTYSTLGPEGGFDVNGHESSLEASLRIKREFNIPKDRILAGGFYDKITEDEPSTDKGKARKNNRRALKKKLTRLNNMHIPQQPTEYLTTHAKRVLVGDSIKTAVGESLVARAAADSYLKKLPKHREASAFQFVNCKINPDFADNPLFKRDLHPYEYRSKSWFCCFGEKTEELTYDSMLAGVLAREALFKPRKPTLLEQLRNKAVRTLADYDVSAYTSQQITDIIGNTVAYVYAGTPGEHMLARVMQSKGYVESVKQLNTAYAKAL